MTNYIQIAIPFFFLAIALEAFYSHWQRKEWYDLHDSLANLACGSVEQLAELAYKAAIFAVYVLIYDRLKMMAIGLDSVPAWAACFILVDLGYYWYHRASHRIHILWAGHGPHHQSEEYNLTVALRQGVFERTGSWLFWLPLALLGFPPLMYLACVQFNNIYQFFIHTRAIKQLGPLEAVLNTPSHHRVHHGKNPVYIDKNYGGVLIIWDKLFGTFEPEVEEPVYGTVSALKSWNPYKANAVFYTDMARYMRGLPLRQKLEVILRPPGWHPDCPEPEIPHVAAASFVKYRTPRALGTNLALTAQFVALLLTTTLFLELAKSLSPGLLLLGGTALGLGYITLAGLIEARHWFWPLEALRLALSLTALWLLPLAMPLRLAGCAALVLLLLSSFWIRRAHRPDEADALTPETVPGAAAQA